MGVEPGFHFSLGFWIQGAVCSACILTEKRKGFPGPVAVATTVVIPVVGVSG